MAGARQNEVAERDTARASRLTRYFFLASRIPGLGSLARRIGPARLKVYAEYPFQVVYADWFDRLAAPIRFYYDDRAMRGWLERARLGGPAVSPTGLFGWRVYGER